MPKGIYYTKEFRSLIYINHVQNDETPNLIDHPNNRMINYYNISYAEFYKSINISEG